DRGGLAGAVGAEQGQQFAAAQLQVHPLQRRDLAVAPACAGEACDRPVARLPVRVLVHGATMPAAAAGRQSVPSGESHDRRHVTRRASVPSLAPWGRGTGVARAWGKLATFSAIHWTA